MSGPLISIAAGTQLGYWAQVDGLGFMNGTSGAVATGSTGEPMGQFLGLKETTPGPAEPTPVNIQGDDSTLGQILFPPDTLPQWVMTTATQDLTAAGLLQTTNVVSIGDVRLGVLQPNAPLYPDCCIIYQGRAVSKDPGTTGAKAWVGFLIPQASIAPLGRDKYSYRTEAVERYKVVTQIATKIPTGVTITDATFGTTGAPLITFTSDNPLTIHRFTGTGGISIFNLPLNRLPVSGAKCYIFVDTAPKVNVNDYSVVAATGVITFVSPPANNSKIIVLYEQAA